MHYTKSTCRCRSANCSPVRHRHTHTQITLIFIKLGFCFQFNFHSTRKKTKNSHKSWMCSFVQTHPAQFTCKFHKFTSFMHTCGVCVCVGSIYLVLCGRNRHRRRKFLSNAPQRWVNLEIESDRHCTKAVCETSAATHTIQYRTRWLAHAAWLWPTVACIRIIKQSECAQNENFDSLTHRHAHSGKTTNSWD